MNSIEFFSITSSILFILGYFAYFKKVVSGATIPNKASRTIRTIVLTINAISYYDVLVSSPVKGILAFTGAGCAFLIFIYSYIYGTFGKISSFDTITLCLSIISLGLYILTKDPFLTQVGIQACIFLGFFPTLHSIHTQATKEHYLPWLIVFSAYIFSTVSLILDRQGNWIELLFPILNGVIMHAIVVGYIFYNDKLHTKKP